MILKKLLFPPSYDQLITRPVATVLAPSEYSVPSKPSQIPNTKISLSYRLLEASAIFQMAASGFMLAFGIASTSLSTIHLDNYVPRMYFVNIWLPIIGIIGAAFGFSALQIRKNDNGILISQFLICMSTHFAFGALIICSYERAIVASDLLEQNRPSDFDLRRILGCVRLLEILIAFFALIALISNFVAAICICRHWCKKNVKLVSVPRKQFGKFIRGRIVWRSNSTASNEMNVA